MFFVIYYNRRLLKKNNNNVTIIYINTPPRSAFNVVVLHCKTTGRILNKMEANDNNAKNCADTNRILHPKFGQDDKLFPRT